MYRMRQEAAHRDERVAFQPPHQADLDAQSPKDPHIAEREKEERICLHQVPESGKSD
jgi:hypothetical protein